MGHRFKCPHCDDWHDGLPDLGYASPHYAEEIPLEERPKRLFLTSDLCVIDDSHFFVRTLLLLPIRNLSDRLGWGVWSTLSRENFVRYQAHYDEDMSDWPPMFGYLSNRLPDYAETLNLQLSVQPGSKGQRPLVTITGPDNHQLYVDQQRGIDFDKALRFVGPFLHG